MSTTACDDQFAAEPAQPPSGQSAAQRGAAVGSLEVLEQWVMDRCPGGPWRALEPLGIIRSFIEASGRPAAATPAHTHAPVKVKTRPTPAGLEIAVWQDGQCVYCDIEPAAATVPADAQTPAVEAVPLTRAALGRLLDLAHAAVEMLDSIPDDPAAQLLSVQLSNAAAEAGSPQGGAE